MPVVLQDLQPAVAPHYVLPASFYLLPVDFNPSVAVYLLECHFLFPPGHTLRQSPGLFPVIPDLLALHHVSHNSIRIQGGVV